MGQSDRALAMLREAHRFPGAYTFKVIGDNTPELVAQAVQVAVTALGPRTAPEVALRRSRGGRHQAISLEVHLERAEQVLELYGLLRGLSGVRYLL